MTLKDRFATGVRKNLGFLITLIAPAVVMSYLDWHNTSLKDQLSGLPYLGLLVVALVALVMLVINPNPWTVVLAFVAGGFSVYYWPSVTKHVGDSFDKLTLGGTALFIAGLVVIEMLRQMTVSDHFTIPGLKAAKKKYDESRKDRSVPEPAAAAAPATTVLDS